MIKEDKNKIMKIAPIFLGLLFVSILFLIPQSALATACTTNAQCTAPDTCVSGVCTAPPAATGNLMTYIIVIIVMVAGVKFSFKVTEAAGSLVDKGVSGATGGAIKGRGDIAKRLGAGTGTLAKGFAGMDNFKAKEEDSRLKKALKFLGRQGQGAVSGAITAAGAPKAISDRLARNKQDIEKRYGKAQKEGWFTKRVQDKTAEELKEGSDEVQKVKNQNINKDASEIKRALYKELSETTPDKTKIAGMTAALKELAGGQNAKVAEDARNALKEISENVTKDSKGAVLDQDTKIDKALVNKMVEVGKGSSTTMKELSKPKFLGTEDKITEDLANADVGAGISTTLSNISESRLAEMEDKELKELSYKVTPSGVTKSFAAHSGVAGAANAEVEMQKLDPQVLSRMSNDQIKAIKSNIKSMVGNNKDASKTIDAIVNQKQALGKLQIISQAKQSKVIDNERMMVEGYIADASRSGRSPQFISDKLHQELNKMESYINDGDIEKAQKMAGSVFMMQGRDPSNPPSKTELLNRIEARRAALSTSAPQSTTTATTTAPSPTPATPPPPPAGPSSMPYFNPSQPIGAAPAAGPKPSAPTSSGTPRPSTPPTSAPSTPPPAQAAPSAAPTPKAQASAGTPAPAAKSAPASRRTSGSATSSTATPQAPEAPTSVSGGAGEPAFTAEDLEQQLEDIRQQRAFLQKSFSEGLTGRAVFEAGIKELKEEEDKINKMKEKLE